MKRRHQAAEVLSSPLSTQQELALLALVGGATQSEAAERAGVARETVCRWLQDDPEFVAGLNRARKDIWDASIDRLRLLALKSTEVLAKLMESDDPRIRLNAAQTALKAAGLEGLPAPDEPLDAEHIKRATRERAQKQSVNDLFADLVAESCDKL
jgi:transcriptional regulator with XRE-family HTH domain